MDTIILKSDLGRTCDEFVEGLFAGKMGVCALRQTKFLLGGVVEYGTTLVSALAKGLRPDRRVSPKKQREMRCRMKGFRRQCPGETEGPSASRIRSSRK